MLWLRCQLPCHHWKVMKRMQSGLLSYMSIFWIEFWLFCFHRYLFFLNAAFPAFIIMSWTNADCPAFIDMLWMNADYPTINDVLWANVDCPAIIKILWTSEDYPAIIDMKECRLPCNYLDKMSKCGLPCRHRYAMNKCELPCTRIFLPSLIFKMQITLRSWYTIVKEIQITQPSLMYCKWMRIPCHHWYVVKWMRIIPS